MKELSIEEKAKAYDIVLERAKEYINSKLSLEQEKESYANAVLETIFPELKESEDEKIRKGLVRLLKELLELGGVAQDEWDRNECEKYISWLEEQGEQKPVEWSEYDEKIKELIIKASDDGCLYGYVDSEHLLDWLNSIKSRYTLYPIINKDNKVLNSIIEHFEHERNMYDDDESKEQIDEEINWLKSLKDRCLPQQKQEWSEEDEHRREDAIYFLETAKKHYASTSEIELTIDWLKSLIPLKQWKPSKEQLKSLKEVIDVGHFTSYPNAIETLYEQLKKLIEEQL